MKKELFFLMLILFSMPFILADNELNIGKVACGGDSQLSISCPPELKSNQVSEPNYNQGINQQYNYIGYLSTALFLLFGTILFFVIEKKRKLKNGK